MTLALVTKPYPAGSGPLTDPEMEFSSQIRHFVTICLHFLIDPVLPILKQKIFVKKHLINELIKYINTDDELASVFNAVGSA